MAKKKCKIKGQTAAKVWRLKMAGYDNYYISDEIKYTVTAVKLYLNKRFKVEASNLWAAEIKAVGACEICGSKNDLNAHHLIHKSTHAHLRYDLSNGVCLCSDHHTFNVDISPHRCSTSNEAFNDWLKENRPGQWIWFEEHRHDKAYQEVSHEQAYFELKGIESNGS